MYVCTYIHMFSLPSKQFNRSTNTQTHTHTHLHACLHTYICTYVHMCADDTCIHLQYAGIYLDPHIHIVYFFVMFVCITSVCIIESLQDCTNSSSPYFFVAMTFVSRSCFICNCVDANDFYVVFTYITFNSHVCNIFRYYKLTQMRKFST